MKLTRVEQAFDGSRLMFYFTADGRVDFRELVRELAAEFHTRIEMRQIGVRDEAKMLGGYGTCGRPLCCTTFLTSFEPVSIKMAKQQDLSLNPSKLSGLCGRLKCCLRYELPNAKGVRARRLRQRGRLRQSDAAAAAAAAARRLRLALRLRHPVRSAPDRTQTAHRDHRRRSRRHRSGNRGAGRGRSARARRLRADPLRAARRSRRSRPAC